jgi:hypothetical protein
MSDDGNIHGEDEDLGDLRVTFIDNICDALASEEVTI